MRSPVQGASRGPTRGISGPGSGGGGGGGGGALETAHADMLALSPKHLYVHGVTAAYEDLAKTNPATLGDPVQVLENDGSGTDFAKVSGTDMEYGAGGVIYPALSRFTSTDTGTPGDWCAAILYKSKLVSGTNFSLWALGSGVGTLGAKYGVDHHTTTIMRIAYGSTIYTHDGALPNGYLFLTAYNPGGGQRCYLNGAESSFRTLGQQNLTNWNFELGATNGDRTDMEIVAICVTDDSADKDVMNAAMAAIAATL